MVTKRHSDEGEGDPLYVRWGPEKTPYTLEIRLEATQRIAQEMKLAAETRMEIGGILLGRLPSAGHPTLRIEDVEIIPRHVSDGPLFVMNPRELGRMLATSAEEGKSAAKPVGLFRGHLRNGPLRPSLADRTLLASRFTGPSFVLLLVHGSESREAALFVASKGELPEEPSVEPFHLKEAELTSLPEVPADSSEKGRPSGERAAAKEPPAKAINFGFGEAAATKVDPGGLGLSREEASFRQGETPQPTAMARTRSLTVPWVLLAVSALAAFLLWPDSPSGVLLHAGAAAPGLLVSGGSILRVTWDGSAEPIHEAQRARLVIVDGPTTREIELTREELRGGAVEYQPRSRSAKVTLEIEMPGDYAVTQTVSWHG